MKLTLGFVLALLIVSVRPIFIQADILQASTIIAIIHNSSTTPDEIKGLLQTKLGQGNDLIAVVGCESGYRQFNASGGVLTSSTNDKGIFQINHIWWQKAKDLGYDISTIDGNIDMGIYIYKTAGIRSWTCARIIGII